MNRDFEFKQLLRAYRAGIVSEATFEQEMKHLENGANSSNGAGGFQSFGKTYANEREAVVRFLEAASAAETNGGDAVRQWLSVCTTDCIRGGLKIVAERETYHGRVFEQRLKELGGKMPDRMNEEFKKNVAYLSDASITDMQKLHRGAARFPNPEETIRPLFEFAASLKEDLQTKEMVQLFAEDELSTLKWQNALCSKLTKMQESGASAAA
jgi:rubrerythrin